MLVLTNKFWTYLLISTFFGFIMLHSSLNASHVLQQYNVKGQNNIWQKKKKNTESWCVSSLNKAIIYTLRFFALIFGKASQKIVWKLID